MIPGLILVATVAVIYYMSQSTAGDAPGHCCGATVGTGGKLDYGDLIGLAQGAGFGCDAETAAAIALAESSGNPNAYNPEKNAKLGYEDAPDGQGSFGLWQIYLYKHPEFSGQNLYDPATNAAAAFSIYNTAGGFSPWSTFKSGKYQDYLQ